MNAEKTCFEIDLALSSLQKYSEIFFAIFFFLIVVPYFGAAKRRIESEAMATADHAV